MQRLGEEKPIYKVKDDKVDKNAIGGVDLIYFSPKHKRNAMDLFSTARCRIWPHDKFLQKTLILYLKLHPWQGSRSIPK